MNRIVIASAVLCFTLSACGGSSSPSTSPTPTTVASAPTTTRAPAAVTTTSTIPLSRDARLAVERCRKALGPFFAQQVSIDSTYLDVAQSACDEAKVQLVADNPVAGTVASDLTFAVSQVNITLGFAKLAVLTSGLDAGLMASIQKSVDDFEKTVAPLLIK